MGGTRILVRLDRFYVFLSNPSQDTCCINKYSIRCDNLGLDHSPVELALSFGNSLACKSRWKMSAHMLKDTKLVIECT